jgi:hypothetical protein
MLAMPSKVEETECIGLHVVGSSTWEVARECIVDAYFSFTKFCERERLEWYSRWNNIVVA